MYWGLRMPVSECVCGRERECVGVSVCVCVSFRDIEGEIEEEIE